MGITSKIIGDQVPKVIMHMLVLTVKDCIATELLPRLYSETNQDDLMEESKAEAQRREEMLRMYHSSREALQIISEINTKTVSTPVPPPIDTDQDFAVSTPTRPALSAPRPRAAPPRPGSSRPAAPPRPGAPDKPVPDRPHAPERAMPNVPR